MLELNKIYNMDCLEGMKLIDNCSIDCVCTDPPYLYLKNQKLDRPFDEVAFFNQVKRILKPEGFVVLFGRGTSFYRWNTILADLGFKFKEEIVWNKNFTTSPLLKLKRIHELATISSLGSSIRDVRINYFEKREKRIDLIALDIRRILLYLQKHEDLKLLSKALIDNDIYGYKRKKISTTVSSQVKDCDKVATIARSFVKGLHETSIIDIPQEHYSSIHPTQKPTRLIERLLALCVPTGGGITVCDPFSGSASTAVACLNTGRKFIGFEIDKEYFDASIARLQSVELKLF
jgi:site-specific DNA-methyltransferase (adenine-specific)